MADEPYGVLDEAMLRPPQIAGCERIPFLVMLGAVAFVTVTGFGLTLPGAIGGIFLVAAGVMLLRRIAAHDPFWFAILFEAARFPRRMPDVLPDRTLPQDLAFVGYEDSPSAGVVALHRTAAATFVVVPAVAAWLLFGLVPALCTLTVLAVVVAAVLVRHMPRPSKPDAA
ncbi:MAG: hypothetical protein F4Y60_02070 [Boseongicola sp. SB0664_bin_43]|uniref:Uncharacterized protein n=1 Tax=Boseongicola sp. SB0664_bin_43 TaxID=2604844 RepID=A0A6B0XZ40_9RHOB|nr:hypothetical protein [Boseongicola sp. SB0664_bin_43]MYK31985.1 hypothetical protein [Boseongicola sp. SB0670_bin_30]